MIENPKSYTLTIDDRPPYPKVMIAFFSSTVHGTSIGRFADDGKIEAIGRVEKIIVDLSDPDFKNHIRKITFSSYCLKPESIGYENHKVSVEALKSAGFEIFYLEE